MGCKCTSLPRMSPRAGRMLFTCENHLLATALEKEAAKLPGALEREEESFTLTLAEGSDPWEILGTVCREWDLNDLEKEAVNLLFLEEGETLEMKTLTRVKPLSRWCALYESADLVEMLEKKAVTVHFQPIMDVKTRSVFGYEALMRGVAPDGSLISPGLLLPKARKADLLFAFDRLCRETALKTAAVKGITSHLFINFIPTSIYRPEMCLQDTFRWAKQLEYDFSKVVFEVVETEQVEDAAHLRSILETYKAHGFKTALDDMGSGFQNLVNFTSLAPDIVKIDRELITGIDKDPLKQSTFRSLNTMARENGIKVLAEGIETKEEAQFLLWMDVDYFQGYYIAKPAPEPLRTVTLSV